MSQIYFNNRVSPRLYKTDQSPTTASQQFFYENYLEGYLKEVDKKHLKKLDHIEDRMEQLLGQLTADIGSKIAHLENISAEQTNTYNKSHALERSLLESIHDVQQKAEQKQREENSQHQSLLKTLGQKISELTARVGDIKNSNDAQHTLLESVNEKQGKFVEQQTEEIDLTQLLFQEMTKKINEIPMLIDEIKATNAEQTGVLLENHELEQASLQSLEERQLKIENEVRGKVRG